MAASNSKLKLKLLIDKRSQKVVYEEANKEFVHFLFSLTTLPLATVVKLLTKKGMIGSIGDLYNSIGSLDRKYFKSSQNMLQILNPRPPVAAFQSPLLLADNEFASRKAYMCKTTRLRSNALLDYETVYHPHVADRPNTKCPTCGYSMSCEFQFVDCDYSPLKTVASLGSGGFVEGAATYMVLDNLEVKPLSTSSCIALVNSFNIHDLSALQEQVVNVGVHEGLRLLQMSLQSKNVLTSVFL